MRTVRNIFGLVGAAIPVLYCGGLFIYFANVQSFTGVPVGDELNPTMIGLGVVGLLFLIPLAFKILRLVREAGAPRSGGGGGRADGSPPAERSDFDPDAAIARYLAQRPPDGHGAPPPLAPARPPARLAAFGRKRGNP
jgi:hypothetical protein